MQSRSNLQALAAGAALLGLGLLADRVPRFFQGDSLSYLSTEGANLPPDRSWAFGLAVNWLVRATQGHDAFIALQLALLLAVAMGCRVLLPPATAWRAALPVFVALVCLDPLIAVYARFYMSDLAACLLFAAFLCCLCRGLDASGPRFLQWLAPMALLVVAAVFLRVAYVPIILLTVLAAGVAARWAGRRVLGRMGVVLALPFLAVAALVGANAILFAARFPGELFANKLSGVFLMGAFAPALTADDFRAAGLVVADAEIEALGLQNYDRRVDQVWAVDRSAHSLVKQRLGVREDYTAVVDEVSRRVVRSAALRDPAGIARVYVHGLAIYLQPSQWMLYLDAELGMSRPLPADFLVWLNGVTGRKLAPEAVAAPSPALGAIRGLAPAYPFLLLAGAALALWGLLPRQVASQRDSSRLVAGAGLLAVVVSVPLFSNYVIPRYMLPAVFLSHLLIVKAVLWRSPREPAESAPQQWSRTIVAWQAASVRLARRVITTPILPAAVALLCLAAYAGQVGMGRWQIDEFTRFATQRTEGWNALVPRLIASPLPFSEGLLFLYGEAVLGLDRPLVGPFLALMWAGVFGAVALAAWSALPPAPLRLTTALGLVASLFVAVLTTGDATETFYWPVAAAAGLPTAGAATALLFLLSRPLDRWRRFGCGAALLVAATSSEAGAALAASFAGAALVAGALRPDAPPAHRGALAAFGGWAWWALPGVAGLVVMAVTPGADLRLDPGLAAPSIGGAAGGSLGLLTATLLLAAGFAAVWRRADRIGATPGRWHAVLAAAIASAMALTVAAAYYRNGASCCGRQGIAGFWLVYLFAIPAMAWVFARGGLLARQIGRTAWLPPVLLTLSLFPVLSRIDGLREGYANYHFATDGRARTWLSGRKAGTGQMEFYLPLDMPGVLIRGTPQPIGTFNTGPDAPNFDAPNLDAPDMVTAVGRFFGKSIVTTCHPWQTRQSWLIHGRFVAACPPHDGPPDIVIPAPP